MNKALDPYFGDEIRRDFIPQAAYEGPDVNELEKTRLWPKVWQVACRVEEIPNVGDFVNYEIVDESILVVRTKKDEISAFYNVCQHRGRRLRDDARGNVANGFYCRFHGWRYALDGSVTYVHNEEDWKDCKGFKRENLDLKQPLVDTWAGFVWINMDPNAEPLLKFLGAAVDRFKNFELEKQYLNMYETIIAPVNWKVVVEAFNEGYHAGATHAYWLDYKHMYSPTSLHDPHNMYYTQFPGMPASKREHGKWEATTSLQDLLYYQSKEINETLFALVMDPLMKALTRVRNETKVDDKPEEILGKMWEWHKEEVAKDDRLFWPKLSMAELFNAGTGWHLFPNTVFLPSVDGTLWYRMRPYGNDPDQCIFDIWVLRPYKPGQQPDVKQNITVGFEAFRGKNPFLEQDFENMEAVHKGMKSAGWLGAVCSPKQELQITQFHKIMHNYLFGGTSKILSSEMSVGVPPKKGAKAKKGKAKPAKAKAKTKTAAKPAKAKAKAVKAKKPVKAKAKPAKAKAKPAKAKAKAKPKKKARR